MTHKERILNMLNSRYPGGVCATEFLEAFMPTYSQRIGDLKKEGWPVYTRRCGQMFHRHESRQIEYYLDSKP